MTTRHPLPGGQWAELLDPGDLSGADQDEFLDKYDELIQKIPQAAPQPDPANPAVALPVPPRQLGREGNRKLEDWIFARVIKAWSFDQLPLPWQGEYRTVKGPDGETPVLALPVLNRLRKAAQAAQDALTDSEEEDGGVPKSGAPSGSGGSSGTSRDGTPSPLPAPPAVTSGTQ